MASLACGFLHAEGPLKIDAPLYTSGSIVNAASSNQPVIAPNTIVTIYGKDLAWSTRALSGEDLRGGALPSSLPGAGARVLVNNVPAALYFVSPTQINFLMPPVRSSSVDIRVSRDTLFGAVARVAVAESSPALFQLDPEFAIASRANGALMDRNAPASGGEVAVLYATGLGPTRPAYVSGELATTAAPLEKMGSFRISVGGEPATVLYAGVAPGYAGLYQINIRLPDRLQANPEIIIECGDTASPPGVRLHALSSNP